MTKNVSSATPPKTDKPMAIHAPYCAGSVDWAWKQKPDIELDPNIEHLVETPSGYWALVRRRPMMNSQWRHRSLHGALVETDRQISTRLKLRAISCGDLIVRKNSYHEMMAHFGGKNFIEYLQDNGHDAFDRAYIGAVEQSRSDVDHIIDNYQIPQATLVFEILTKVTRRITR